MALTKEQEEHTKYKQRKLYLNSNSGKEEKKAALAYGTRGYIGNRKTKSVKNAESIINRILSRWEW